MNKKILIDQIKPLHQLNLYGYDCYFDLFIKLHQKKKFQILLYLMVQQELEKQLLLII